MNTIVVGYSGSEAASRALARAAEIAEALSARLVVVSVAQETRVPARVAEFETAPLVFVPAAGPGALAREAPPLIPERAPAADELARRELEGARMQLATRHVEAEYVAEVGDPADRLLAVAAKRDADLVVVGSREHGFVERFLGGAVDETVARHTDRDVLLVH